MHIHLLFEWKSTAISISALEKHLNYSLVYSMRNTGDLKKRPLINASMLIAHNGKKHSNVSTNLYLR